MILEKLCRVGFNNMCTKTALKEAKKTSRRNSYRLCPSFPGYKRGREGGRENAAKFFFQDFATRDYIDMSEFQSNPINSVSGSGLS